MKGYFLIIFLACASASQYIPRPTSAPIVKPGKCPRDGLGSTCDCRPEYITCIGDHECPGAQKCCSWGCGCKTRCMDPAVMTTNNPICFRPKVVGPCEAYYLRYWYNKRTNQCVQFIFGGCRGNQNNFETKEECEKQCKRRNSYLP